MRQGVKIANFGIVIIMLLLHGCSIYTLRSSKEFRKNRFVVLALYLSLSDIALALEFIYHNILRLFDTQSMQSATFQYQCMMLTNLICRTVLWSLIQTLLICLERLNATFTTKKTILNHLTSNKSVILCFIVCHVSALLRFGIETISGPIACDPKNSAVPLILFSHDIPYISVFVLITSCYAVVVYRITRKRAGTIGVRASQSTKADTIRMRKNVITLGLIITLILLLILLRYIAIGLLYIGNGSDINDILFIIFNNIFALLNPLLDPVIYVLRIKKYRDYLRCKCLRRNSVSDVINLASRS